MIGVRVIVEFDDDTHSPSWIDGESFTCDEFLPAIPPIDTVLSGIVDYDGRGYSIRVYRVEMTLGDSQVRVYGMVV
jgi:hypothetical protein